MIITFSRSSFFNVLQTQFLIPSFQSTYQISRLSSHIILSSARSITVLPSFAPSLTAIAARFTNHQLHGLPSSPFRFFQAFPQFQRGQYPRFSSTSASAAAAAAAAAVVNGISDRTYVSPFEPTSSLSRMEKWLRDGHSQRIVRFHDAGVFPESMRETGYFSVVIQALVKTGQQQKAIDLLLHMRKVVGLPIDWNLMHFLLSNLCEKNMKEQVISLLRMIQLEADPNSEKEFEKLLHLILPNFAEKGSKVSFLNVTKEFFLSPQQQNAVTVTISSDPKSSVWKIPLTPAFYMAVINHFLQLKSLSDVSFWFLEAKKVFLKVNSALFYQFVESNIETLLSDVNTTSRRLVKAVELNLEQEGEGEGEGEGEQQEGKEGEEEGEEDRDVIQMETGDGLNLLSMKNKEKKGPKAFANVDVDFLKTRIELAFKSLIENEHLLPLPFFFENLEKTFSSMEKFAAIAQLFESHFSSTHFNIRKLKSDLLSRTLPNLRSFLDRRKVCLPDKTFSQVLRAVMHLDNFQLTIELLKQRREIDQLKVSEATMFQYCSFLSKKKQWILIMVVLKYGPDCLTPNTPQVAELFEEILIEMVASPVYQDKTIDTVNLLVNRNIVPTLSSFTVLIETLQSLGSPTIIHLFKLMSRFSIKPQPSSFGIILEALSCENMFEEALEFIETYNIDSSEILNSVIYSLGRVGRVEEALSVFQRLVDRSSHITLETYGAVITSLVSSSMFDQAIEMLSLPVCKNVTLYSLVLSALAKTGMADIALKVFGRMEYDGIAPSPPIFVSMIQCLSQSLRIDEALKFFELFRTSDFPLKNIAPYNLMLQALVKAGRFSDVNNVFTTIKKDGLYPNRFSTLQVKLARQLMEAEMTRHSIKPPTTHPNS